MTGVQTCALPIFAIETGIEGGYRNWHGAVLRRLEGAQTALAEHGLTTESEGISIVEVPCTRQGGVQGLQAVWAQAERPTAIVAFSDIIALGVLDAARDAGVAVPRQLSVTGFDDLTEAQWSSPALTTVRQPIASKGRLAAEYLVEAISSGDSSLAPQHQLHTTLLIRESTGAPPR